MDNKVSAVSAATDPTLNQPGHLLTPAGNTGSVESRVAAKALDQADLRLVIEEQAGTYVYKTVDRRTGDVVAQYPREDVLKMREEFAYMAGDVIRAKV